MSCFARLSKLLLELFPGGPNQVQIFFQLHPEYRLYAPSINWNSSLEQTVAETVLTLLNRQLVNNDLFERLKEQRPGQADEIEEVRTLCLGGAVAGADPFAAPFMGFWPFVDRQPIRDLARQFAEGRGDPITILLGGENSGKSYCQYLFSHLQSRVDVPLKTFVFDFEDWSKHGTVGAGVIADAIKIRMQLDILDFEAFEAQSARSTLFWRQAFIPAAQNLDQTWCWFFDSMDKVTVAVEARDFIEELAICVVENTLPIRVFLTGIGRENIAAKELREFVKPRVMNGFQRTDVDAWIRAKSQEDEIQFSEDRLNSELDQLFNGQQQLSDPEKALDEILKLMKRLKENVNE